MVGRIILGAVIVTSMAGAPLRHATSQYYPYPQYQQSPQYYQYQQNYQPSQQYAPAQSSYYQGQQQYQPAVAYAPALPQYCMQNNTAAGALAGGAFGSALGGIAGGGRGALIGGLAGAVFGGASGAQADAQCQQIAAQIVYQQAAAQYAAAEAQIAQQAAQAGTLRLPAAAYEPVSADYQTPSNGHRHRITVKRLNSYSEPATRQICDTFTRIDFDFDGNTSSTTNARRCKGSDGQWRDAA